MHPVEASVVVPLSPEESWDFIWDNPQRAVEHFDDVVAIEDYEMRDDGTPDTGWCENSVHSPWVSYLTTSSLSALTGTSTGSLILPSGGNFYGTYEPTTEGTRIRWRWEIEPQNSLAGLLLPVVRALLALQLQRVVDSWAKGAAPQEDQPQVEDQRRRLDTPGTGLIGGVGVAVVAILALYLLRWRRSSASRRWAYWSGRTRGGLPRILLY
jgi:hypothetical protein